MSLPSALVIRGDANHLPLPDASVDLIVTSPPYFALRSYKDGGDHYAGQVGSEPTPAEFLAALWACTTECWRVLKPSGSMFVNLGDKYSQRVVVRDSSHQPGMFSERADEFETFGRSWSENAAAGRTRMPHQNVIGNRAIPEKSLMGLPWRYAIGCIDGQAAPDQQQWILRAEIVWDKPNGLPESVRDRVRRSHEQWFHFTKEPRYYSAIDEIREAQQSLGRGRPWSTDVDGSIPTWGTTTGSQGMRRGVRTTDQMNALNPLGKLPGSVWSIPSEPLRVPEHLGIDHFACVDEETEILTRRGWLRHDALAVGDEVAGYDSGLALWTRCHAVHRYPHTGELVAVEKRGLSMRLTSNHRVLAQRKARTVEVLDAADLGSRHAIPQSAEWVDDPRAKGVGTEIAALCGWVSSEGWYTSTGEVRLSQSLTANPEKVAAIDALLASVPFFVGSRDRIKERRSILTLRRRERERIWRGKPWVDVEWALPLGLCQELRRVMPEKLLPVDAISWPTEERRALLDAFVDGDGHRRSDGRLAVFQKERHNLDVLQAIAVTLGYRARLTESASRFVLYLTSGGRALTLRGTNGSNAPIPREHHDGLVWCPTTGTGTFIARRRGTVFITGNSFPSEWPRRLILGWSPSGICTECGEGRRPTVEKEKDIFYGEGQHRSGAQQVKDGAAEVGWAHNEKWTTTATITGYACACSDTNAPTTPARILDPFGGTGTTAMVARALGRTGISIDLSHDYSRLARWRIYESGGAAKAEGRTNRDRQGALGLEEA